ncbi:diguanylate cyclase [uncultured Paraglaciecola sp.]|uniref:diguanylate cyclase n=1 Tax=uncultured Paraglaciecola sp. TaxID=1765024 RepID=UPI00260498F7|nr:diguanylate cyclase [uncultured Paraglaciecola sp.]
MTSKLEQKLADFRVTFISEFNEKLTVLVALWSEAKQTLSTDTIRQFRFEVHSIKGASSSLNFLALSDKLNIIEEEISGWQDKTRHFEQVISTVDTQMNTIIEASKTTPNTLLKVKELSSNYKELRDPSNINQEIIPKSYQEIRIAIVDYNKTTLSVNAKFLAEFGFIIDQFDSIEQLDQVFDQKANSYSLVLIDTDNIPNNKQQIFTFAAKMNTLNNDVFILSSSNTFEDRVAAVRAKVNEYLLKPVNITTLVSKIRKNFKIDLIRPYRILLLDDQTIVGNFYKTLLEDTHVEVLAISQPETIMVELESFHPDVFMLDMHMPNISGIEVARLLRQQAKYDYVPIIFLTSDDNINTKLEVLECGADDVILKNTPPKIIVQQVDSRIQRGQEIRYLASRDSLTGVLNHGQIMESAFHALRLASRQHKPTVVVMIDLDHFKAVNDEYGHVGGDKVLISLGQLLLQSVRDTDYVGRYGGEEFMVVFSDADPNVIESKMNNILTSFLHINFTIAKQSFNCSFSAGLASSTHHKKLSELISAADSALYKAKHGGRSQVCVDEQE